MLYYFQYMYNIIESKSSHSMLFNSRQFIQILYLILISIQLNHKSIYLMHFKHIQWFKKQKSPRATRFKSFGQAKQFGEKLSNQFFLKSIMHNSKLSYSKHTQTLNLIKSCCKQKDPNSSL